MNPPPPLVVSSATVKPSDLRTSSVIAPDPEDQITYGKTALEIERDVVFSRPLTRNGPAKPLVMDIQMPLGVGPRPVVVYVPGGGFALKENALDLRTFVAESGFVVASVEYRTVLDGADYRDSMADIKSAIRFLRAHAENYAIDPRRIAVWGESAGGYLAAMVGVTGSVRGFDIGDNLDQSSKVQAVVDEFGPSDLSKIAADFDATSKLAYGAPDNPIARYINGPAGGPGLFESAIASGPANPLRFVTGASPPFLLLHGDHDTLVSPSQTLILHERLRAVGVRSTRYVVKGANHGDLAFKGHVQSGLPWSTNQSMGLIVDFLRRTLD
jgi:acetyl esterase/lipase